MASSQSDDNIDVVVIGAGISGLVTAKCLREVGLDVVILEKTDDVGGLWTYREDADYGVMSFTHINVSKHNYCFSDFPFGDNVPDFPHHKDMAEYVKKYSKHFGIDDIIKFQREVTSLQKKDDEDGWEVIAKNKSGEEEIYSAKYVAICSGHHAKPAMAQFIGQDKFKGKLIHASAYKDMTTNKLTDDRIVIVGIGNSAIDAAINCATNGSKKPVILSTRSGAWVVPNYIFGYPVDHYACRLFLKLPWRVASAIFETVIKLIQGSPYKWNLNPKMHVLQTQPTVSPVLVHYIQRGYIKVVDDVQRIEEKKITFKDGESMEADCLIMSTGYRIDLPFLSEDLKKKIQNGNELKLYKNVFCPEVGSGLAFIGFVQPASGGILTMSEIQARWFGQLCKGSIFLPSAADMYDDIAKDKAYTNSRWYGSARHTIQKDPIIYNDEIASFFGAKPELTKNPLLAWRLLLGSCGAAQWRLQGPGKWPGAVEQVRSVPVTFFIQVAVLIIIGLCLIVLYHTYAYFSD